jgi:PAS domain S-box-containing protein
MKKDASADKQERNLSQEVLGFQSIMLENAHDAVIGYSLDNKVVYWNKAAEKLYGFTTEEALGRISYELLKPRYRVGERDKIVKEITETGRVEGESTRVRKDGKEVTVEFRSMLVRGEDGSPKGYISFDMDITEKKNLESLLRNNERLAAIGATAGMVGHDIRNPLQAIVGDLYLIASDVALLPECEERESIKESVSSIRESVDYIDKIIQDLQDYAKPLKPIVQKTGFEEICQEVLLENSFPENIEAKYVVEDDVKEIVADPALLKRILRNLIDNAVQAMPDGGKLVIQATNESDGVVIIVQDSGVGVSEDVKPKLFTPLFTTKAKGQGFGLAVVKRMTEALGGTVSFESEEGKGTMFIVRLPLVKK